IIMIIVLEEDSTLYAYRSVLQRCAIIGIIFLIIRPLLMGVAFLGFSDPSVETGAFMPEKKVLPVLI
ncbi:TPA: hypothetical protein ACQNI8_001718, partial [Streptococcus pyogenes]